MTEEFDQILDKCIDRLNRGESLQQCFDDYPEKASELKPLLVAMTQTKKSLPFTPLADVKWADRQRFLTALENKKKRSFWEKVKTWQPALIAAASITVVLIVTLLVLRPDLEPILIPAGEPVPTGIPSTIISKSNINGNFAFLVSDEENAIGDFSNLFVTVDKVLLIKSDGNDQIVEFVPDIQKFDLTLLPGRVTQELWRGQIPEGIYTKVYAYVSEVNGVLKSSGKAINVKLPSDTLQLANHFQVTAYSVTRFTFDITVVRTGSGSSKYILKPQATASGATLTPRLSPINDQGKPVK